MSQRSPEDGRSLAERKVADLTALSWEELDRYDRQVEEVELPSGEQLRVVSLAFWDMDAWESDMLLSVKVYATRGWRRFRPYTARGFRGGEDLPDRPAVSL
jgi:hypothetical protein